MFARFFLIFVFTSLHLWAPNPPEQDENSHSLVSVTNTIDITMDKAGKARVKGRINRTHKAAKMALTELQRTFSDKTEGVYLPQMTLVLANDFLTTADYFIQFCKEEQSKKVILLATAHELILWATRFCDLHGEPLINKDQFNWSYLLRINILYQEDKIPELESEVKKILRLQWADGTSYWDSREDMEDLGQIAHTLEGFVSPTSSTTFSPVLAEITLKVLGFILAHNQSSTHALLSDDRLHNLLKSQEKIAILTNNIPLAIESCEHITRLDCWEDQRAKAQTRIGKYLIRTKTISNLEAARIATEKSLLYPEIVDPVRAQALTQLANIHRALSSKYSATTKEYMRHIWQETARRLELLLLCSHENKRYLTGQERVIEYMHVLDLCWVMKTFEYIDIKTSKLLKDSELSHGNESVLKLYHLMAQLALKRKIPTADMRVIIENAYTEQDPNGVSLMKSHRFVVVTKRLIGFLFRDQHYDMLEVYLTHFILDFDKIIAGRGLTRANPGILLDHLKDSLERIRCRKCNGVNIFSPWEAGI